MIHDLEFWKQVYLAAIARGEHAPMAANTADVADGQCWERVQAMPNSEPSTALLEQVRAVHNLAHWAHSSPGLLAYPSADVVRAIEIVHAERAAKAAA